MAYLRSTKTHEMIHVDLATAPEGTIVETSSGKAYIRASEGFWYDGREGWLISPERLEEIAEWIFEPDSRSSRIFPDGYAEMCVTVRI